MSLALGLLKPFQYVDFQTYYFSLFRAIFAGCSIQFKLFRPSNAVKPPSRRWVNYSKMTSCMHQITRKTNKLVFRFSCLQAILRKLDTQTAKRDICFCQLQTKLMINQVGSTTFCSNCVHLGLNLNGIYCIGNCFDTD